MYGFFIDILNLLGLSAGVAINTVACVV